MWISKGAAAEIGAARRQTEIFRQACAKADIELAGLRQLQQENARLRADMDWFKHRLNQVERERGQLIQAAIGVKISVPEFVPTYEDPGAALNETPDLSTVGMDARPDTDAEPAEGVDYSQLPGYKGK